MSQLDGKGKGKVVVVGKTAAGKEIGYRDLGWNRFKEIVFTSGGEVPEKLKGNWLDPMLIERHIKAYLAEDTQRAELAAQKQQKKSSKSTTKSAQKAS